ncbi:cupin domain-containing protein [Sphingomonas crusticola]|uniref:cupin domain-containing protein n=1 Tax=Sphingomonas crusticola TaxID=1697973 RepID=UPI000E27FAF7|nr:cupin domain-containing protein [Sphingomonas crusticola]
MSDAAALIERHGLAPHPEGGWYRETWRAAAAPGERAGGTAILFLLERGQSSHWHKVDADELWLWHSGAPLELQIGGDAITLDATNPQALVPANVWQAARAGAGWALVSCVVVPGFDFAGFTLAPAGWEPDRE